MVLVAASLVGGLVIARAEEEPTPVPLEKTWDGEISLKVLRQAHRDSYITGKKAWEKLWRAFRGKEKVPEIDFEKSLVLLAVSSGPQRVSIQPTLDKKGDLTARILSTSVGYTGPKTAGYQFALIRRDRIKTIHGKPIAKGE
jgi:hypothetical protein